MPLKLCDLPLSRCNGCFRKLADVKWLSAWSGMLMLLKLLTCHYWPLSIEGYVWNGHWAFCLLNTSHKDTWFPVQMNQTSRFLTGCVCSVIQLLSVFPALICLLGLVACKDFQICFIHHQYFSFSIFITNNGRTGATYPQRNHVSDIHLDVTSCCY